MSNEWLTTGAMIDRLKVGEVAELKFDENVPYSKESAIEHYVTNQDGIRWCVDEEGKEVNDRFVLADCALNYKWRILPNYVSFEEAMKALKEGKRVWCEVDGEKDWFSKILAFDQRKASPSFREMFYGKWTIEDDTP